MSKWRMLIAPVVLVGVLFGVLVACSDGSSEDASTSVAVGDAPTLTTTVDTTAAPETTEPAVTDAPTTTAPAETWQLITAPADCMCSDGSGFNFFVHRADPAKVVFFLEGGGACFSAETCSPDSATYKRTGDDALGVSTGIFDFTDPANPFKDWSMVYVPYCTGDVHLGNLTKDYGNGVVVEHKGFVNTSTALTATHDLFPDAEQLVVTGESAGSVPTPLYAGMAFDLYPDAAITVLADGSGAYPDIPALNATIGGSWGTMNAVPPWPENAGMTPEQWSLPGLFVQAHKHAPSIVFARHDYAFDETQTFFAGLAGIPADNLVALIDQNEAQIEASGMELFSYISPGSSHTILGRPEFYTETLNGIDFVQWVTDLAAGTAVADNHCTDCQNA